MAFQVLGLTTGGCLRILPEATSTYVRRLPPLYHRLRPATTVGIHRMNTVALPASTASDRRRWFALVVVCLAQLMNVLDTTIVNVALPKLQHDLHFTQANLAWVLDAYLISFGSLLLL